MNIYFNQTITWKPVTGTNEFAEPLIGASQLIKVRWEGKRRLVRDKQGQEVVSEARFFCTENIQVGDIVEYNGKEWTVIAVTDKVDLDGNVIYREAAC